MISLFVIFVFEDSKELLCHLYGAIFQFYVQKRPEGIVFPSFPSGMTMIKSFFNIFARKTHSHLLFQFAFRKKFKQNAY